MTEIDNDSFLKIQPNIRYEIIKSVSDFENNEDVLLIPDKRNFPAIDFVMMPDQLFQLTVAKKHPIKHNEIVKIVKEISHDKIIRLYFVVPEEIYDDFTYQNYITKNKKGGGMKKIKKKSMVLNNVEQWVLKIPTRSELIQQLK